MLNEYEYPDEIECVHHYRIADACVLHMGNECVLNVIGKIENTMCAVHLLVSIVAIFGI